MLILRKESPILFAQINNIDSAFYEEVQDIPKHVRKYTQTHTNIGSGTQIDDIYYWSNTYGITSGKIFKRVRDGLILEPCNHVELNKINEFKTIEYVETVLGSDAVFKVTYSINDYNPCMSIQATHKISEDNLKCNDETEFIKYSELFRGRHEYYIFINAVVECSNKEECSNKFEFMSLRELKEVLKEFIIEKINVSYYENENRYFSYSSFYQLEEILTLNEAAEFCGKTEGAIRKAIKAGKLIEGKDWRKAGRITLVTKKSIESLYGKKQ